MIWNPISKMSLSRHVKMRYESKCDWVWMCVCMCSRFLGLRALLPVSIALSTIRRIYHRIIHRYLDICKFFHYLFLFENVCRIKRLFILISIYFIDYVLLFLRIRWNFFFLIIKSTKSFIIPKFVHISYVI